MNATHENAIRTTFNASNAGRLHFGEVIGQLVEAGVQSYSVDYRSHQTVYHLADDNALVLNSAPVEGTIADSFSVAGVQAAIKSAQSGSVMYPEFKRLSMQAGCTGYIVWIAGRHVSYFGRKGEVHVERFPV